MVLKFSEDGLAVAAGCVATVVAPEKLRIKFCLFCISVRSYLHYFFYIVFLSFISYYTFVFLELLCNNLYSFACFRCNHFCFKVFFFLGLSLFLFFFSWTLNGLGGLLFCILLRMTHYRCCRFFFAQKNKHI